MFFVVHRNALTAALRLRSPPSWEEGELFKNLKKGNQKLLPLLGAGDRAESVVEESKLSSLPRGNVF